VIYELGVVDLVGGSQVVLVLTDLDEGRYHRFVVLDAHCRLPILGAGLT